VLVDLSLGKKTWSSPSQRKQREKMPPHAELQEASREGRVRVCTSNGWVREIWGSKKFKRAVGKVERGWYSKKRFHKTERTAGSGVVLTERGQL